MRGTPTIESANKAKARDHPRVCGEHAADGLAVLEAQGSSPRMRGTRCSVITRNGSTGIIPAYAGNTLRWTRYHCRRRDHPRVCGEHFFRSFVDEWGGGSSPRMRGTHGRRRIHVRRNGIIPAYAGNTPRLSNGGMEQRDHPRVCGEHSEGKIGAFRLLGSSPRMRGTLHSQGQRREEPGIIPAYAGNTLHHMVAARVGRDHPRVCGEHLVVVVLGEYSVGSSPRMRGTR